MRPSNAAVFALAAVLSACVTDGEDDDFIDTIYVEDGEPTGEGKADSITRSPVCDADGEISKSACAFLGAIAFAEGTHGRYDFLFSHRVFSSFDDHPRIRVCASGYCSTAAGRYQILSKTWTAIRSGLPDFGPDSQDQAAIRLIKARGVSNLDSINTYDEFSVAIRKVNREWASLPGSPYGQPTKTTNDLWTEFKRLYGI
jgi:muramidase (phage lysozyme)